MKDKMTNVFSIHGILKFMEPLWSIKMTLLIHSMLNLLVLLIIKYLSLKINLLKSATLSGN